MVTDRNGKEIKAGMKVKRTSHDYEKVSVGEVCEVVRINAKGFIVLKDKNWFDSDTGYDPAFFVIVEEKPAAEFKIGDKVRIKKGSRFAYQFDGVGMIDKIEVISCYDTFPYHIKEAKGYCYAAEDLELAETPSYEKFSVTPVEAFSVGDKVRLLCEPYEYCRMSAKDFPVGGVFDVFELHNDYDPKQITILNPGNYRCYVLPHQIEKVDPTRISFKDRQTEFVREKKTEGDGFRFKSGDRVVLTGRPCYAGENVITGEVITLLDRLQDNTWRAKNGSHWFHVFECDIEYPFGKEKPKTITSHTPIVWDDVGQMAEKKAIYDAHKPWVELHKKDNAAYPVDFGGLKTDTQYKSLVVKHLY